MTLTKVQIVDSVNDQIGFTKDYSSELVETLLEIIKQTLESGEDVLVSGFGKFCVKEKKERTGRNPNTGESAVIRSRRVLGFRCSRKLREKINS